MKGSILEVGTRNEYLSTSNLPHICILETSKIPTKLVRALWYTISMGKAALERIIKYIQGLFVTGQVVLAEARGFPVTNYGTRFGLGEWNRLQKGKL